MAFRLLLTAIIVTLTNPNFSQAYNLQYHSRHFLIYHSQAISHHWVEKTSRILESRYKSVGDLFGHYPRKIIAVRLYDKAWEFTRDTGESYHTGAVYDGTLKIQNPATLQRMGTLNSILTHEYCHLVLDEITRGKLTLWMSEGLAVYVADQNPVSNYKLAIKSFAELNHLLRNKSSRDKTLYAYSIALSVTSYLIKSHSWPVLKEFLKSLDSEKSFDFQFKQSFGISIKAFESKVLKSYGKN